jgi:hypothetical protein
MKQVILTQFPWPWLPTFALLLFFAFFSALIVRVCLKSTKELYAEVEKIALEEGERHVG